MGMIDIDRQDGHLEIKSPATLQSVDCVVEEAMRFVAGRLARDREFDFKLLLREALINAVVHGCEEDPGKTVASLFVLDGETMRITVTDEGPGFDWSSKMDAEPDPGDTCGRGLMILRLYSDGVSFNQPGNSVTIVKRLKSPPPEGNGNDADSTTTPRESDMFEITKTDSLTTIKPDGDIVASVVEDFKALLQNTLRDAPGALAIDLSGTTMIDSMGIGLLIAAHNTLGKSGEKLRLLHPSQDILTLFRTMRLDKHFIIDA